MTQNNINAKDTFLYKLSRGLDKVSHLINKPLSTISSILLFLLMFLTLADVIGRRFFSSPITGTYELTEISLAIIIFFGLGIAQINKDHLEIDFVTNKFSERVQNFIHLISSTILFFLLSLLTWQLFVMTNRTFVQNELSGDLGLPIYIFVLLVSIGSLAFTLTYLVEILKSFIKVVDKNE